MSKLFCFGFGYTARHLADRADGFALAGTARTARSLRDLAGRGFERAYEAALGVGARIRNVRQPSLLLALRPLGARASPPAEPR